MSVEVPVAADAFVGTSDAPLIVALKVILGSGTGSSSLEQEMIPKDNKVIAMYSQYFFIKK